jgi:hypothetical protein
VVNLIINTISSVLLIVALFRGKKDSLAGIFFIVTALPIVFSSLVGNITSVFAYLAMRGYNEGMVTCALAATAIIFFANLFSIAFRVLLAIECFKPGKISGSKTKNLLLILPIVNILLTVVSTMVRQLYLASDYGFGSYLSIALLPAVLTAVMSIGTVILGLAFSIPVYEKNSYAYGAPMEFNFS